MRFLADHSFRIGAQHLRSGTPCQDYAASGLAGDGAYAIVSDGCSSGGRTDIGARIITLLATKGVVEGKVSEEPGQQSQDFLGITDSDMLATCLIAKVTPDKTSITVMGDGVVAIKADGHSRVTRIEWANNMPCYPSYVGDELLRYIALQGGPGATPCHVDTWIDGYLDSDNSKQLSVMDGGVYRIDILGPVDAVAVFSDGVSQIDGVQLKDAVYDLMDFKSVEGGFVKRRMNRFLRDPKGKGPIDDISCAAILVEP